MRHNGLSISEVIFSENLHHFPNSDDMSHLGNLIFGKSSKFLSSMYPPHKFNFYVVFFSIYTAHTHTHHTIYEHEHCPFVQNAAATDISIGNFQVEFSPQASGTQMDCICLRIQDDGIVEADETIVFTVSGLDVDPNANSTTIIIRDSDST